MLPSQFKFQYSSFISITLTKMAGHQPLFDGPSFDLGIEEDTENFSLLIVEDTLDKEVESDQDQEEVISQIDNGVKCKKIESPNGIEGESNAREEKHGLDLNVIEPYDIRFLDLNMVVLDLNKFPEDRVDFGFENEELNEKVHWWVKIFVDSSYCM